MRLPDVEHLARPWRIHEIAPDFRLEDVWTLPTPGGAGDFPRLLALMGAAEPGGSALVRVLFALRWKIGGLLGWDRAGTGLGARVPTLRDRLPADLRDGPCGADLGALPFEPLYATDDEFAAEIANETMHGVLHVGWVEDGAGRHRGQMAVLVKPNGLLGNLYMAAIKPFRLALVYPQMMRDIERRWRAQTPVRA